MSGSSQREYYPPQKLQFNCENSEIRTNVSSIDLNVLINHKIGDILLVEVRNNSIILTNGNGETLGSIIHSNITDLVDCINSGNVYEAKIINIIFPQCTVIIKRKV